MANKQINDLATVVTSAVTSSANFEIQDAGQANPQSRQLNLLQLLWQIATFRAFHSGVTALSSGMRVMASSASVTGTLAINTGLTTITNVVVSLRGTPTSTTNEVTWSALASSGWFSALTWAQATATNVNPVASGSAATVDWIAFGT